MDKGLGHGLVHDPFIKEANFSELQRPEKRAKTSDGTSGSMG